MTIVPPAFGAPAPAVARAATTAAAIDAKTPTCHAFLPICSSFDSTGSLALAARLAATVTRVCNRLQYREAWLSDAGRCRPYGPDGRAAAGGSSEPQPR